MRLIGISLVGAGMGVLLWSCSPTLPEGRFQCVADADCPKHWLCRGGEGGQRRCFAGPDAGGPIVDPDAGDPDGDGGGGSPDAGPKPDGSTPELALTALGVMPGTLSPAFQPAILSYEVDVPIWVSSVTVLPTAAVPNADDARIEIGGAQVPSGERSQPIDLSVGDTLIDIVVTAAGVASTTYRITAHRGTAFDAYIKASNAAANDYFGRLALSGDGLTLAVGAPGEDGLRQENEDMASAAGAVYLFHRSSQRWDQVAYLKGMNADMGDQFGFAVALSADGSLLAVGAPFEDSAAVGIDGDQADNGQVDSGAVYVFAKQDDAWVAEAYVKASNSGAQDNFGMELALSADGSTLAVGAPGEASAARDIGGDQADDAAPGAGAVYVFKKQSMGWAQVAYVKASNADPGDQFGSSIGVSDDGSTLVVGAYGEAGGVRRINGNELDNSASGAGAAYVFRNGGDAWQQEAYIKASNAEADDSFSSIALSGDGTVLAVGASGEASAARGIDPEDGQANDDAPGAGAAYLFAFDAGEWQQRAYLKASNAGMGDGFGGRLALSSDGTTLVVGARGEASASKGLAMGQAAQENNDALGSGAVYVFRSETSWSQQTYVKAVNTFEGSSFGQFVGLSADGRTLAVGATLEPSRAQGVDTNQDIQANNMASGSGAAYVFR